MGGRGSGSGLTSSSPQPAVFQIQIQPPHVVTTSQQAQQANAAAFPATDNSPYHQLANGRQYYMDQNLTTDQINATIQQLRMDTEPGTQYSMIQNMNTAMVDAAEKGVAPKFNANQAYTYKHLMSAMHNLGQNVFLTRYDHPGVVDKVLTQAGVKNADFTKIPIAQLQKALVGRAYGEERFISTSYTNFKNAPQSSKDTFVNRAVRIEYKAKASTQALMPGNGPGGRLDEVLLAPSGGRQNMRIVGVRYDNSVKVRQKGTNWLSNQKQLVLEVEVD